jgi:site-specific DNA recombinase
MKACLYCRISTGEQSNFSLEAQHQELKNYCRENNIEVFKVFQDRLSGLKFEEREGLQIALDCGEKGLYDLLLVTEMDRLARDTNILGYIKLTLQLKGIKIIAINEPEAKTEYDELISGVIGLFGSFEAKRRKRRCLRGIKKAREEGKILNRVPRGYKFVNPGTKQSKVVINEPEARLIKSIFQQRIKGISMYKISQSTSLNKATIRYILKNRFYFDKDHKGTHKPIISREIFDKANRKS